jgi:16S rRNA (adenine1518-N6/adenine1519-N6)-dimethyltransferase
MLTKNQLKELFFQYDFRPLKRFGENYLIDGNIKNKIIEEADLKKGDSALEIGPGLGALTIDLADSGANICAVEKDKKAFAILSDILKKDHPNLRLVSSDILDFDLKAAFPSGKIKVIGNLPYYVTTPILEYLIGNRSVIRSILVLIQREVADRLLASPGTKDYASISCFVQYFTRPAYIYTVKRTSFYPEPEVDSSLIRLDVLDKPSVQVKDEAMFFKVVRGAFNQRRKTIINSLSREAVLNIPKEKLAAILKEAGVSPESRPEILTLTQFAAIADAVV